MKLERVYDINLKCRFLQSDNPAFTSNDMVDYLSALSIFLGVFLAFSEISSRNYEIIPTVAAVSSILYGVFASRFLEKDIP